MTDVCESSILQHLELNDAIEDTFPWSEALSLDHKVVVGAVKSLLVEGYVTSSDISFSYYTQSPEAAAIVEKGTQEIIVLKALNDAGRMTLADLDPVVGKDVSKIGVGTCMKNQWVKKDGADLVPLKTMDQVTDAVQEDLKTLIAKDGSVDALDEKVS
jgi:phenylalanyl-tRNA synthetase alpha chain